MRQTPPSPSPKSTKRRISRSPRTCSTISDSAFDNPAPSVSWSYSSVCDLEAPVEPVARPRLIHVKASDAGATRPLPAEEYFHGYLPAEASERVLQKRGDFLVRKVVNQDREELYLSFMDAEKRVKHTKIVHSVVKKMYFVQNYCFDTPAGLIAYHLRRKQPVDAEGNILLKGIAREKWQLYHEQIHRKKKVGDGAFGEVWLGTLHLGLFSKMEVAIKTPLGKVTAAEHDKLFQEAQLMRTLDHPNCIKLIGVALHDEPLMIVIELAPGGAVVDAVRMKPGPSVAERIRYAYGALKGLAFLESRSVIHRDVAARNTLISAKGEAKISDFGLSILGTEHKEKRLHKVPVRYLAPETLSGGKYSSKSDVWSYGILIWEIFYDGQEPYEDIVDAVEVKRQVKAGRRLQNTTNACPKHLWDVATSCWTVKPADRPSFAALMSTLRLTDAPSSRFYDHIAWKFNFQR
uniref:Tyrosine-protein kinase n=1 Tax=Steinernema glaseri TaxID=37863 RepID=A0A1I8ASN1_9BILA